MNSHFKGVFAPCRFLPKNLIQHDDSAYTVSDLTYCGGEFSIAHIHAQYSVRADADASVSVKGHTGMEEAESRILIRLG
jgi:hypothetical protein